MSATDSKQLFVGLLLGLHSTAWMQLGKVVHPGSGKVERDLEGAKATIDLLGVLETKTRGNLAHEEERLLTQLLLELRMNYVEELKQGQKAPGGDDPAPPAPSAETPGPGSGS